MLMPSSLWWNEKGLIQLPLPPIFPSLFEFTVILNSNIMRECVVCLHTSGKCDNWIHTCKLKQALIHKKRMSKKKKKLSRFNTYIESFCQLGVFLTLCRHIKKREPFFKIPDHLCNKYSSITKHLDMETLFRMTQQKWLGGKWLLSH